MTRTHRSQALTMALYTFLLALGAAMPLVASYQPGLTQRADAGHVRCGGYRGEGCDVEAGDEDQAELRPRRRVSASVPVARTAPSAPAPVLGSTTREVETTPARRQRT